MKPPPIPLLSSPSLTGNPSLLTHFADSLHWFLIILVTTEFCRLEKLYGGKAYVGLRIPDADTSSRQDIDLVLLTKG